MRLATLFLVTSLVLAACGETTTTTTARPLGTTGPVTTSPVTTSPVTTSPVTTSPVTTSPVGDDLSIPVELLEFGFDFTTITIGDRVLHPVAVADTARERSRGLMFITDMGDVPGMLFVYEQMRAGTFWMKNTLVPLDIAFFDGSGRLVDKLQMEPCPDLGDDCPTYAPAGPFQFAFEAPLGNLAWVGEEHRLVPP